MQGAAGRLDPEIAGRYGPRRILAEDPEAQGPAAPGRRPLKRVERDDLRARQFL